MKPLGLISQISAIGLAISIVALFVRPTLADIGNVQTEIQEYQAARERVMETNQALASHVAEMESVNLEDRTRLSTYMPALLDEVAVLRDIEIIAQNADVNYSGIQYNGILVDSSEETRLSQSNLAPVAQEFSIVVDGNYGKIKDFFSLLEQNHYPLQIHALKMGVREADFLSAEVSVVTYVADSIDESQ